MLGGPSLSGQPNSISFEAQFKLQVKPISSPVFLPHEAQLQSASRLRVQAQSVTLPCCFAIHLVKSPVRPCRVCHGHVPANPSWSQVSPSEPGQLTSHLHGRTFTWPEKTPQLPISNLSSLSPVDDTPRNQLQQPSSSSKLQTNGSTRLHPVPAAKDQRTNLAHVRQVVAEPCHHASPCQRHPSSSPITCSTCSSCCFSSPARELVTHVTCCHALHPSYSSKPTHVKHPVVGYKKPSNPMKRGGKKKEEKGNEVFCLVSFSAEKGGFLSFVFG